MIKKKVIPHEIWHRNKKKLLKKLFPIKRLIKNVIRIKKSVKQKHSEIKVKNFLKRLRHEIHIFRHQKYFF